MLDEDQLQNALILIKHHAIDAQKALEILSGNKELASSAINDILEIVKELTPELPDKLGQEVNKVSETSFKQFYTK